MFPAIRLQFAIFFLSTCSGACAYATAAHAQESRQQSPHSEATESSEHAKTTANSADGQKKAAIEATFKAELEKVKEAAAGSMNVCITSIYIAARDAEVQKVITRKLVNPNYVFKGVRCLDKPGIPEQARVLFDFDCTPGIFCLLDPDVLVIVNLTTGHVVDIIDPYVGGSIRSAAHSGIRSLGEKENVRVIAVTTPQNEKKFVVSGQLNPAIHVARGETVRIEFTNGSTSHNHDWNVRYNGRTYQATDGGSTTIVATVAGTSTYYCSVDNHAADGMKGDFIVDP